MKPLKILISAYACRPHMGSEPGVGWNIMREVAQYHQVWLLTRQDNVALIREELAQNPIPNVQVIDCPVWGEGVWKRSLFGVHIHYYLWQIRAYFVAKQSHQEVMFDAIHHVTYVRYSTPSFLSLLPIPMLWGPVGGGEMAPAAFWQDFSLRAKVYEWVRVLAHRLGELDPFTGMTARRCQRVQATTTDTADRLKKLGCPAVELAPESGMAAAEIERLAACEWPAPEPLRVITMARLLHWKGIHLGIRAFAAAQVPTAEYWIVGDGPERSHLAQLAQDLGVGSQVKFTGRVPRDQAIAYLSQSHALIHPSLHDSGGWVCLEAMAAGRPVICLALGGPDRQVVPETGFKIPALNPEQAVQAMAAALQQLATHPELGQQMGKAGQERVKTLYSWSQRGQTLAATYNQLQKVP
ncbi:glycosyltransferase [Spirulina subsalsa CS-330]|uniref:glycosyltransferase n=1 Tax=Spirulina TaxID=1154 RepID=UPI00232E914A|nr:glycosyltransferase [Spirulina subsalsa]MDB9496986.1 glycosyltransferase [Spirulina subsalsa CS-330]